MIAQVRTEDDRDRQERAIAFHTEIMCAFACEAMIIAQDTGQGMEEAEGIAAEVYSTCFRRQLLLGEPMLQPPYSFTFGISHDTQGPEDV